MGRSGRNEETKHGGAEGLGTHVTVTSIQIAEGWLGRLNTLTRSRELKLHDRLSAPAPHLWHRTAQSQGWVLR